MNPPLKHETTTPYALSSHSRAAHRRQRYRVPGNVLPTRRTTATIKRYSPPARRALVDFDWPSDVAIDVEYIYDVIQNVKEHGWAASTMKQRALARSLRSSLPEGFEPERLERLIGLLKEHDEYR